MQRKIEYTLNFRNRTPIEEDEEYLQLEDFKDKIRAMMSHAGMDVEFGRCEVSESVSFWRPKGTGEKEGNDVGFDNDHDATGSGSPEDHRKRIPRL